MHVELLSYTPDPLRLLYTAARTCYSAGRPAELWAETASAAAMQRLIEHIVASGHHSILEHAYFNFALGGISRSCSHQLVRHRLASYSQQSQRYVEGPFDYVTPPSWEGAGEAWGRRYHRVMGELNDLYREALAAGIPAEDARFVLPNACSTQLVMSMNLRQLVHTVGLRTCTRAQWEIRRLFEQVAAVVRQAEPFLGAFLVTKCERLGYCDERESCGRYPLRADVLDQEERK
ncbi:MAG: FAD-dependent thymidylate synthase [Chloroflexia bacterium]|nr:FAD-dependent thymidylate synthase [Chloroflexia bacterium]